MNTECNTNDRFKHSGKRSVNLSHRRALRTKRILISCDSCLYVVHPLVLCYIRTILYFGYQAGVWQNLLAKGTIDVQYPAAFKLAVVLRHTPAELTARLLADLLQLHPQSVSH